MKYRDFPVIKSLIEAGDPMYKNKKTKYLTDREKRLIGIAVAVTRGCVDCTGKRIEEAINSGIDKEVITESINLCAAVNAGFEIVMAIEGYKKYVKE